MRALFVADTFLILGVCGCSILPLVRFFTKKKLIVNVEGREWSRIEWNQFSRKFLRFSERMAVRYSHNCTVGDKAILATTEVYSTTANYAPTCGVHNIEKHVRSRRLRGIPLFRYFLM